jgi:hypothetical protein
MHKQLLVYFYYNHLTYLADLGAIWIFGVVAIFLFSTCTAAVTSRGRLRFSFRPLLGRRSFSAAAWLLLVLALALVLVLVLAIVLATATATRCLRVGGIDIFVWGVDVVIWFLFLGAVRVLVWRRLEVVGQAPLAPQQPLGGLDHDVISIVFTRVPVVTVLTYLTNGLLLLLVYR